MKKGLIKAGVVGFLCLVFFGIIFFSLFSSAYSNKQEIPDDYTLFTFQENQSFFINTTILFDFVNHGNYKMMILTPSGESISRISSNDNFLIKLEEEGEYSLTIKRGNGNKFYNFFVISSELEPPEEPPEPEINPEDPVQSIAEINKPVEWTQTISEENSSNLIEIPPVINLTLTDINGEDINYTLITIEGKNYINISESFSENISGEIKIEYVTEPPKVEETVISESIKEVVVSSLEGLNYKDVLSYTYLPREISSISLIKIYWRENNTYLDFNASDTDDNGLFDYIEWIVPHLSTQTFEIIVITKAEHLDSNKDFISDIYEQVKEKDNIWSEEISEEEYVRVTFEVPLDNTRDITIYPRIISGNPVIEVYEKDENELIAKFDNLIENEYNKIYLKNLIGEQDTFDLKILGGSVEFDHIIDPNLFVRSGTSSYTANTPTSISFSTAMPNTNYSVLFSGQQDTDAIFSIQYDNKATSGFRINRVHDDGGANESAGIEWAVLSWGEYNFGNLLIKCDTGSGASTATTSFTSTFPDTNYAVVAYTPWDADSVRVSYTSKAAGSWNSRIEDDGDALEAVSNIDWCAVSYGTSTVQGVTIKSGYNTTSGATTKVINFSDIGAFPNTNYVVVTTASMAGLTADPCEIEVSTKTTTSFSITAEDDDTTNNCNNRQFNWIAISSGEFLIDLTPPEFSFIPSNSSLFYGNESLGVDFDAEDETGFGYYSVNDTRFSINSTGYLTNETPLHLGNYLLNITINDTSNNINSTIYSVQVNKSTYPCEVYFNANSPITYPETFIVYTNCNAPYTLTVNGTSILNSSTINSGAGYYNLTVQRTDTENYTYISDTEFFQVNKNSENCEVLFNESFPLESLSPFLVWTNCSSQFTLYRNGTEISNYSEQRLLYGPYNFSMSRNDFENYTIYYNEKQIMMQDTISPIVDFGPSSPKNNSKFARDWIYIDSEVIESNEVNITFDLYDSDHQIFNSSTYIDKRRETNWTNLPEGIYYFNITVFDVVGKFNSTSTRKINLNFSLPNINFVYPTETNGISVSRNWIYTNVSASNINEEINISFGLYNGSGLVNQSIYTDSRREINWTNLPEGIYYYNVTLFDNPDGRISTLTRQLTLDTTNPNATLLNPENGTYSNLTEQNLTVIVTDNSGLSNMSLFVYNETHLINETTQEISGTNIITGIVYNFIYDGIFKWFYKIFDSAGNSFETENKTITIDTTYSLIEFAFPTEENYVNTSQSYIYVNVSATELNEANITFDLYDSEYNSINSSTYTDSRRAINWTNLPEGFYVYNSTILDLAGNINYTETRQIGLDFAGPVVTILEPQQKSYSYNESLPLKHTVYDSITGLSDCWWNLDNQANQSIPCNTNTTFNATEGQHTLYFYSNDSLNQLSLKAVSFSISLTGPVVILTNPLNNTYLTSPLNILFNYTTEDPDGIDICSLYGNWNSGWHRNQSDTSWIIKFITSFYDNFEDGSFDINWTNTAWTIATDRAQGTYSSKCTQNANCDMNSNLELDTSYTSWVNLSFRYNDDDCDAADIILYFNDSSGNWDNMGNIDAGTLGAADDTWNTFTYNTSDSQYKHPGFAVRFFADPENGENYWVDNINITYTAREFLTQGNSSFSLNLTSDGKYLWNVECNDSLGFSSFSFTNNTFTIDSTYPKIEFAFPTEENYVNKSQNFIFVNVLVNETNEVNITFDLYNSNYLLINSSTYTDSRRTINWTNLINGKYHYNVSVFDYVNFSNKTSTRTINLDTEKPASYLISPEDNIYSSETILNLTANFTDNLGLYNASLMIYDNQGSLINETSLNLNGLFSEIGILYNFETDGEFKWSYLSYDLANNSIETSNRTIIIDTTYPLVDFGVSTPRNNSKFAIDWIAIDSEVTEANEVNITFYLYYLNYTLKNSSTYTDFRRTINWTNLPEGIYYYNISVFDFVNYSNSTSTRQIKLNFSLPTIDFVYPTEENTVSRKSDWIYVNASTSNVNEEINISFGLYNGSGLVNQSIYTDSRREINWTNLPEGIYYYNVTLFDNPDGRISTLTRQLTLDTTNPNATLLNPENETYSNSLNKNLTLNITDNFGISNFTLFIYNQTHLINETFQEISGTNIITGIVYNFLYDGIFKWFYKIFDVAGNSFETENNTITIDTTYSLIEFVAPTEDDYINKSQNFIFVNVSVNEVNEANITFDLYDSEYNLINSSTYIDSRRTINWTNILEGIYYYNVTIVDLANNVNYTETRKIGLDFAGPVITIIYPKQKSYGYNESLPLEHTVYDLVSGISSCWWNLDNQVNESIPCNTNTTFNTTEGQHTLYFYSNDSLNQLSLKTVSFSISLTGPVVILTNPLNNTYLTSPLNILFNYTTEDPDGIDMCSLYGNWNSGWHRNQSDTSWIIKFITSFYDNFEDGSFDINWTNTAWTMTTDRAQGTYSSKCAETSNCDMNSNLELDTSYTDWVNLSFRYNDDDCDAADIILYLNDSSGNWDNIRNIDAGTLGAADDTWNTYTYNSSDSQYKHPGFAVRFFADPEAGENYWIDNINITYTARELLTQGNSSFSLNLTSDGIYLWNVECNDSLGYPSFAFANRTLIIDTTPPVYSDVSINQTGVGLLNLFSINISDNINLFPNGSYIFSTNNSGSWVNETPIFFTSNPDWANVSKILNSTVNTGVGYKWYFNDSAGNSNSTPFYTLLTKDITPPYFTSIPNNASLFYGNESLGVDFNAEDETSFGYYSVNDTRFSINSTGYLTNTTPLGVGNYELNITINDTYNNINSTIYKVQVNKSTYYDCGVYFNASSPITYPETFIVYTNCSSAYTLYRNGTTISNNSVIASGAGYYNITVRRTDTQNYTNTFSSEFFTIQKNPEEFNVLFNSSSPLTYPDIFLVWANSTTPFTLRRNNTIISNNSIQNNGAGYFNFSAQRTDTSNYSFIYNQSFFTVNKNPEFCQIFFNETSPIDYPSTFLVWTNCSTPFNLYRNGTLISNNSEQSLTIGAYNFSMFRIDTQNYSIIFNQSQFRVIDSTPPYFTSIPNNASLFYGNESLGVDFNAEDETSFGYYSVNDTRFSINSTGYLTNTTPLGVGNYELNITINDTYNNINSTIYKVQVNKSTYYDCGVYFNASSPITYPETFIVYTNCSSAYTLYRNGTTISNNSVIASGAGYYNLTVRRTDTQNYTNTFSSEFFTVNKNPEEFNVLFNASSPIIYPEIFSVWANSTTPFTLRRNNTIISNNSIQNNGAGYFNFSAQRSDTSNYSFIYNQSIFTVNKNPEFCQIFFNETSPIDYPSTFLVWANCSTPFTLRRNGTIISNNSEQRLVAGFYNFSFLRTDTQNYSLIYNEAYFTINRDLENPYFTFIPPNASIFYRNESLGVDFDATDSIEFGYYSVNDTRFSINQSGFLRNSTVLGAGNYSLNITINDSSNNINWTIYKVQVNKSTYYDCGVYFNTSSPIIYPETFTVYTNCSSAYTLYRNGTSISNNSVIRSGAGYYNITVRRTDTQNYTNTFSSEFFTVNKNPEEFNVLFNASSPIIYPEIFSVWANSTTPFTLRRNNTIISNNSIQNNGAGYFNFSAQRSDTSNYSFIYNQSFFTVNKAIDSCSVYFNTTSPITYPENFIAYTNCSTNYNLYLNGTSISNNSVVRSGAGYYNITVRRTDSINYTNILNTQFFAINKNPEICQVLFNESSPLEYPKTFLVWANCTSPFTLYRNASTIINNTEQALLIGAYNFSMLRNDSANYTFYFNQTQMLIIDITNPNATLIYPENNTLTSSITHNLTLNATDNYGLSNMTLFVYNQTNLINQTTQEISGTEIITGIVYNFIYDGIFKWFYKIFDVPGNSFNTVNNTITIDTTSPVVSLISPYNGKVTSNSNVRFASNFSEANNLVNATFYLWNSTEDLINITTINITGNSNSTNLSVILPYYDAFKWNYLACDNLSNCDWNSTNYSLEYELPEVGISVLYPLNDITVAKNKFFNITLNVTCFAGECGTVNVSLDPISWWDSSWIYRKQINITNNNATSVLESGYSFNITLDTTGDKFLDNGNDVRIVYYNGTSNIELDRINTTSFNSSSTILWFKLQSNISASSVDSNYSVYYGNPYATNPPTNKSNIYLFYDNFTDSSAWSTFSGACSASSSQGNPVPSLFMSGSGTTDRCYATNFNLPSTPYLIEADVYISSTGGRGIRNIGFKHTTSHASGYMYRMQTSGGDGGFFTLSGTGTWTKLGSNDADVSADTWHNLKLLIRGTNFTAWMDGNYRNSVVSSTYSNTKIGTQDDGGADTDSYVDNYLVKRYIYPDPSSSLGIEETGIKTGLVSMIPGTIPFYTNISNPYTTSYLTRWQSETIVFYVNATGAGTHTFFAFANLTEDLSINDLTLTWNVTIDITPPELTIISPSNQSYDSSSLDFNISANEPLSSCKFTFNNWLTNYTMNKFNSTYFYYTNTSMNDNLYTVKFSCIDLAGNINNSENINFTVDAYGPNINLTTPLNNTYSNNTSQNLSFSAADSVGLKNATLYIFNSSGNLINFTNIFISGKTILTGIIYTFTYDDIFTWFYKIFDIANNEKNTQNNTIIIDTKNPLISYGFGTELNFANVSQNWIYINITLNETNFANLTFKLYNGSTGNLLFNQTTYSDSRRTINWTNLQEGLYWYNVTVTDLALNKNTTSTHQIRLDTSPPEIKLVFPNNLTYGYNINLLSYTVYDPLIDQCWYSINDSSNISITCGQNISTFLNDGTYTWKMYSNDTLGHLGLSNVSFKIDTDIPAVIIYFPENITYNYNISTLNFTATDVSLDKCWYILNGGENITIDCSFNITHLGSQEGLNELHLFANDSDGNIGADFVFFSVDTTPPHLRIINPENNSYYPENILFNISGSENLDYCIFSLDDWTTNYTMNRYNLTDFSYVLNSISTGVYNAKFWCNDTMGNINSTENIYFSAYYPNIILDLIYPTSPIEVPRLNSFNFTVNVSCEIVDCGIVNVTLDPLENWWNESWNYRRSLNLSGIGTELTDFQINISINLTEDYMLGKVNSDCSDIRFTNSTSSEISYWTESCYINGSNSIFWIKVPSISSSGNTTLFMYYGNTAALNVSNGTKTFDYFDSGDNVGSWTIVNSAGQTSAQGLPQPSYYAVSTNGNYMYKNIGLTTNRIIEYNSRSDGLGNLFFLTNSAGSGQHMRLETRSGSSTGIGSATAWSSWAAPSQTCSNLATNTWFNFRLVIGSTTAQSYVNDVACGGSYTFSNNGEYIGLVGDALGGTYTTWWDNLRVRKYSSTTPSYSLSNEENKAKGIISTNIGDMPFFADENPKTTLSLKKGESQLITFIVNATGSSKTYEFFTFANLVKNSSVTNSSSKVNVTIFSSIVSLIYPEDSNNFSDFTIPFFNFSINEGEFTNCQLFGSWGGWGVKQTINNPSSNITLNFSSENVGDDGTYFWNVKCIDNYGGSITSAMNFTFSTFLFPDSPNNNTINISQSKSDGTGEIILTWESANHSDYYRIYFTDDLKEEFALLAQTNNTNYVDTSANNTRRRFYRISNWNPVGENFSEVTLGKTIYYLKRKPDVNTRNWIGFYLENENISNAYQAFQEVSNITAFTMWNSSTQKRVTCNEFSCPNFPICTDTNCNFDLEDGVGYEVNLNTSSPVFTNWSLTGRLKDKSNVSLITNLTSSTQLSKNWISLFANSSLINAHSLITSIPYSDALTNWNELNQVSEGYIQNNYSSFPPYFGINFVLESEGGYEVSVTQNSLYTQS